ncbi:MAG: DUF512 domain-containing protein [Selenomonadaceae bacterium]|nr:DUF512 domain-containing protein [Selenomonadaceae bacterium]
MFLEGLITKIEAGSIAEELELVAGDKILQVNGKTPTDIIDLSFLLAEEEIELLVEHADGEREIIAFEKDVDEELGAEFESAVFDGVRCCKNHCVFCFVDMIAPNMRKTLSIKDDDYRLSFLFGNFITLTNLTARDFRRIKNFHLSPLFVSVHSMNPELRAKILRTPLGAKIQTQLDELERAGVEYHTQVVLCKDLNDGAELEYTIAEIFKRVPHALSLAIVPVGVTRHRRDKFPLKQFDKESAAKVIAQVEKFQWKARKEFGRTFVYLGDEFYFLAEKNFPPVEHYDDFPQIENGIGMTRNFIEEFGADEIKIADAKIDVVSGTSFAKILERLTADKPNVRIVPVENKFFGARVNVSGLLTGGDIIAALRGGERDLILIPATALKAGEEKFLDDVTVDDLRKIFAPAKVLPIRDGFEFRKILESID